MDTPPDLMMTRAFRDAWSAALRSGKYKQGRGYLCAGNGYCCLGVAYEIEGIAKKVEHDSGIYTYDRAEGFPDSEARQRWGLSYSVMRDVTRMNDCEPRKTFAEIADYLDTLPVRDDPPAEEPRA